MIMIFHSYVGLPKGKLAGRRQLLPPCCEVLAARRQDDNPIITVPITVETMFTIYNQ